jgi:uncharacterized protein with LGFP repeats
MIGYIYHQHDGGLGRLGFPTSGEMDAAPSRWGSTGRYQRFEERADLHGVGTLDAAYGGSIYWHAESDAAHLTWGGIGKLYESLSGTDGIMGFPTSNEYALKSSQGTNGWCQHFEGGDLYHIDDYGTFPITKLIQVVYQRFEGPAGRFGFPKFSMIDDLNNTLWFQEFEGGVICLSADGEDTRYRN